MISLVAAMTQDRVIGCQGKMPWHLPRELQHFKSLTWGKPIVMGRKTYDGLKRPLPGRRNLVLSRQPNLEIEGCEVFPSLDEAIQAAETDEEVMVIGGGYVFELAIAQASRIYLTLIDAKIDGDTYFPEWDQTQWTVVSSESFSADEANIYAYQCLCLEKSK